MKKLGTKWIRPKGNRSTPILAGRIRKLEVIKIGRNRFTLLIRHRSFVGLSLTVSEIRKILKIAEQNSSKKRTTRNGGTADV